MAHKIAGVAGVYGCLRLRRCAMVLESCIERDEGDPAPLVDALAAAVPPALEALRAQGGALRAATG